MIKMKGNSYRKIKDSESSTRKQGTECTVLLLQTFGNNQQCRAGQETEYST